jgi:hypothetical protein
VVGALDAGADGVLRAGQVVQVVLQADVADARQVIEGEAFVVLVLLFRRDIKGIVAEDKGGVAEELVVEQVVK